MCRGFNLFKMGLMVFALLAIHITSVAVVFLDRIVAVVNNDVIMDSELKMRVVMLRKKLGQQNQHPNEAVLRKKLLDQLIAERLQLQVAERAGIEVNDEALNLALTQLAKDNNLSLSDYKIQLEKKGYDYVLFRENLRNEIIMTRLRQRYVDNRITINNREMEDFMVNEAVQNDDISYRIQHILLTLPDDGSEQNVQDQAAYILAKLSSGESFSELAEVYSDGQQAAMGGDLGWRTRNEIPSLFIPHIDIMRIGEISPWIKNNNGWHLIRLVESKKNSEQIIVDQYRIQHILIKPDAVTGIEGVHKRLLRLKRRIENGEDFSVLAKAHSEDVGSASKGGDLDWMALVDFVPEFAEAIRNLQPGVISMPFNTQFGGHIALLLETRKHDSTEFLKRTKARKAIYQRKFTELYRNWLQELKDSAYLEYRLEEN